MENPRIQAYVKALIDEGIPQDLAIQCARIIDQDDASKPNLGRSKEQQELVIRCKAFSKESKSKN